MDNGSAGRWMTDGWTNRREAGRTSKCTGTQRIRAAWTLNPRGRDSQEAGGHAQRPLSDPSLHPHPHSPPPHTPPPLALAICFKMLRDLSGSDSAHLSSTVKKIKNMAHEAPGLVLETIHDYFADNPEVGAAGAALGRRGAGGWIPRWAQTSAPPHSSYTFGASQSRVATG